MAIIYPLSSRCAMLSEKPQTLKRRAGLAEIIAPSFPGGQRLRFPTRSF